MRLVLTDNGPEFQGAPWSRLAKGYGFAHTTIAPHNACANGIVERLIRDIKDRAIRIGAGADGTHWRFTLDIIARQPIRLYIRLSSSVSMINDVLLVHDADERCE